MLLLVLPKLPGEEPVLTSLRLGVQDSGSAMEHYSVSGVRSGSNPIGYWFLLPQETPSSPASQDLPIIL